MSEYFVLVQGNTVYVKEGQFFRAQGGTTADWGKAWRAIDANSVEDARRKALSGVCKHGAQVRKCEICEALHNLDTMCQENKRLKEQAKALIASVALKQENGRLQSSLQKIVSCYEARSELYTNDADCAANQYDWAKQAVADVRPKAIENGFIEWIEPFGPKGEPVYMRVPYSTAIAVAKTAAASKGHSYASDEQALEDFIVVHWARRGTHE